MIDPVDVTDFSRRPPVPDDPLEDPYAPQVGPRPQNSLTEADLKNATKTGTTIVGVTTEAGVVMASDMRASLGGRVVSNKNVQKVEAIQPNAALSMSGSVGGAQS